MSVHKAIDLSGALADYLEAIYMLSHTQSNVRITDIALRMGISKPSANRAVNSLKRQGLVSHEPYGDITLTEKGKSIGESVNRRHGMIKNFLINVLSVKEDDAENEARRIEHNISQNTVDKMKSFMEN